MSAQAAPGGQKAALGLSIASHSGLPPAGIGALAAAAERAGFTAVAVAEGHGDALALCHPVAAATRRVRIGTAVANAALRPPVLTAKTAAQLDQAAGGRFTLGLGVGNPVMNGRFGIEPFPPLAMIEEYVAVVRAVLAGQASGHAGRVYRTGMVPLDSPPVRPDLPIYLGALGPRMLGLAGRIADGVILNLMSPARPARRPARCAPRPRRPGGTRPRSRSCAWCTAACPAMPPRRRPPPATWSPATCCIPRWPRCSARRTPAATCRPCASGCWPGRAGAAGRVPQPVADAFVAHGERRRLPAPAGAVPGRRGGPAGPVPDAGRR